MLVEEDSRKYTAFRTHKETYEWCVAPMGLAGVPGLWSRMMNTIFYGLLFVVVYMDDIAVCSKTMEEHVEHLRQVFELFRKHSLYGRVSKCEFAVDHMAFLGHEVSGRGLAVDANKVRAIEKWAIPTNRKQIMSFLGLAGYYRKFICDYATIVLPLSQLAREKVAWQWGQEQQTAFEVIKLALQQAPVLQLADPNRKFIVTTDASGYFCGAVLSQLDDEGNDRPVAFMSKTLGVHEINWPAYEQELFAIKLALTKWRHFLLGQHFDVYTDNSACKWLLHTPELNPKMTRWLDFFAQFTFTLHHRPGALNVVADALSRPPKDAVPQAIGISHVNFATSHDCDEACKQLGQSQARHSQRRREMVGMSSDDRVLWLDNVPLREGVAATVANHNDSLSTTLEVNNTAWRYSILI